MLAIGTKIITNNQAHNYPTLVWLFWRSLPSIWTWKCPLRTYPGSRNWRIGLDFKNSKINFSHQNPLNRNHSRLDDRDILANTCENHPCSTSRTLYHRIHRLLSPRLTYQTQDYAVSFYCENQIGIERRHFFGRRTRGRFDPQMGAKYFSFCRRRKWERKGFDLIMQTRSRHDPHVLSVMTQCMRHCMLNVPERTAC